MPALVLFGTRTFVGGDDLRAGTFFAILLRVFQIVLLIPYTVFTADVYDGEQDLKDLCGGDLHILRWVRSSYAIFITFLCTAYITTFGGLMIEIGIWRTSAKGTPVEPEKRARLQPLCRVKLIPMSILRIINMVLGIILTKIQNQVCWCGGTVTDPLVNCPQLESYNIWFAILIGTYFLEVAVVGLLVLYFLYQKTRKAHTDKISSQAKWHCCCRCCCTMTSLLTCCLYGGRDGGAGDFADIALILADFFDNGGALDVVPSDIVVGLKILARVQRQKQAECRQELRRRVSFVVSMKKSLKAGLALDTAQLLELQQEAAYSTSEERAQYIAALNQSMKQPMAIKAEDGMEKSPVVTFAEENNAELDADNIEKSPRVVTFADEEMGHSFAREVSPTSGNSLMVGKGDIHGSVSNEGLVEEIVAKLDETKPEARRTTLDHSIIDFEAVQIVDDLAQVALADDRDENEESAPLFPEQNNRRQAVVYNLHRTPGGGFLDYKPSFRNVLSRKNDEDKLAIAEGARFIRFSNGIYYFRRYAAQGRSCEVCCALGEKGKTGIQKASSCVNRCRRKANEMAGHDILAYRIGHGYGVGDMLERRFLAAAELDHAEIKYVQFGEGVARTPYCIAVDHAWKSVVIVVRGTEGLDDVVADLRMVPTSMEDCGKKCDFDGQGSFVHAGMLACSEWIYDDIKSHELVDKLLMAPRHAGYTLRITGHSLGAGIASILAIMLKRKHPTLRCHCFCPPGCTLSTDMAESCKDFTTSYVLDHDIVPRISFDSLENLRHDMLDMIARLKVTKLEANRAKPNVDKDTLLHRQDSTPPSKFQEQLDEFQEQINDAKTDRYLRSIPLFPPGKIIQLVKTADDEPPAACCCSSSAAIDEKNNTPYAARWAQADDFKEITISSHFLDDHSTINVMRELERTASVFGLSSPYTVDEEMASTHFHPRRAFAATLFRPRQKEQRAHAKEG